MKFGDVVTAVASLAVILVLVGFPVNMVLRPTIGPDLGGYVSGAISILLTALIGGYIFAGKIGEDRMNTIAKITVLSGALMIFYVISFPALADWNPAVKEAYLEANPGTTLSTSEWLDVEQLALLQGMFINVVMVLVLVFIGLYVGSMLRKPSKS